MINNFQSESYSQGTRLFAVFVILCGHIMGLRPKQMRKTATTRMIRAINRSAVLGMIRQNSPTSYTQIAQKLNISLPTVMRIVDELIQQDFVRLIGFSQIPAVGRPRGMLEFNGRAYCVICLDLGGPNITGALLDLDGNSLGEIMIPVCKADGQKNLDNVLDMIERLSNLPRSQDQHLLGIGIGIPGVTQVNEGIVTWAASLGWSNLPLVDIIAKRFIYPVFIENDVNIATLAELNFGAGRGVQNFVYLVVRTAGMGAGIVIGGALYRGQHMSSGEVGYLLPGMEYLGKTYEGYGALEYLTSGQGILKRAYSNHYIEKGHHLESDLTLDDVFFAAEKGEIWAKQVIDETIDYLGIAVTSLASILDPEVICFGGVITERIGAIVESIEARIKTGIPFMPRLEVSSLGDKAVMLGATNLVLAEVLDFAMVKSYV
jgi:predicted NBD/HSP70 family sugar kinase